MSDDTLDLGSFELKGIDRAQIQLRELIATFGSAERAVIKAAQADETASKAIQKLTEDLAAGKRSAAEVRDELAKLAALAPQSAAQMAAAARASVRAEAERAAQAEKTRKAEIANAAAAEKARKADLAALEKLGREVEAESKKREAALAKERKELEEKTAAELKAAEAVAKHRDEVRKYDEARGRQASARSSGMGITAEGTLGATGAVLGGLGALVAGTALLGRELAQSASEGERHAQALARLGDTYRLVEEQTRGTISAEDAYRSELTLTRSGLRVSGDEFATIARHARDHRDVTQSAAEATQELAEALRNGEKEGLRKFGISVQDGATRAQTFERALRQMRAAAADAAPAERTLAEETQRTSESIDEAGGAFSRLLSHLIDLPGIMRSVADGLRAITRDVNDLVDAEQRAPAEQRQREARLRAQQQYAAEVARAGQTLTELGVKRGDPRRRALIADPAAFGRLSPEQQQAVADRVRQLNADLAASRAPQRSLDDLLATRDNSAVRADARLGAFGGSQARPLSPAELEAEAAGLRARMAAGRTGGREAQDRAVAIGRLTAINADITTQARAAMAAERPRTQPRDSAATGAAADPLGVLRAEIALQKQLNDARRADAQAQSAARLADLDAARFGARLDQERIFIDERAASERTTALQREIDLVGAQLEQTRRFEERARSVMGALRQPAQRVQAQQLANELATREAEIVRTIVASRLELQRIEAETARQQRDRLEQQKAERYAAEDERARRYRTGEIAAFDNPAFLADELAQATAARRVGRLRAALGRRSELEDMRSPEGQAADLETRRGDAEVARERSLLEERYELQRTFTERWVELHGRQVNSTRALAEGVNGAFEKMGQAISLHVDAALNGQETLGDALRLMLADTLGMIGKEATVKGAMELAEAAATLLIAPPLAAQHLAAAGAYAGVAALAIGTGAAVASGTQPANGGARSASRRDDTASPSRALGVGGSRRDDVMGGTTVIQLGGGMILGTPRQLAEQIGRVVNAPASRFRLDSRVVQRMGVA